jgi:hypothetical protein
VERCYYYDWSWSFGLLNSGWPNVDSTMTAREQIAEQNDQALFADGFDEAIIGMDAARGRAIYDYMLCAKILMDRDEMTEEEAHEYMEFNVVTAFLGPMTPLFIHPLGSF